jgi:hypothetical protein
MESGRAAWNLRQWRFQYQTTTTTTTKITMILMITAIRNLMNNFPDEMERDS